MLVTNSWLDAGTDTPLLTMMVMQWGQFISHDVSFTPMSRGFNKSMIKCCDKEGNLVRRPNGLWGTNCYNTKMTTIDRS